MNPTNSERHPPSPRERFARAVDEPRAGTSSSGSHQEFDTELAVVRLLRHTPTPGPDAAARQRIYDRVHRELDATEHPPTEHTHPSAPRPRVRRMHTRPRNRIGPTHPGPPNRGRDGGIRRRLAVSATAVLCLFAVLGGLSMVLAKDALPGDTLYDVRRLTERASVQMSMSAEERANKQLGYAADRLRDMDALRTAGAPSDDFRIAFDDFDADTTAGSRAMTSLGTTSSARAFTELHGWLRTVAQRLDGLTGALPAELRDRARASTELLGRIDQRINALRARLDCATITSGLTDRLGPLPARAGDCRRDEPANGSTLSSTPPERTGDPPAQAVPEPTEQRPAPQPDRRAVPEEPPRDEPPAERPAPLDRPLVPLPDDPPLDPNRPERPERPERPDEKPIITVPPLLGLPQITIG